MLYKFKSRAAMDVVMLEPHAEALLRIIGKEPAPKGIIQVQDIPRALQALKSAVQADKARIGEPQVEPAEAAAEDAHGHARDDATEARISLSQRAWPLMHMMELSLAENRDIVWGV